MKRYLWLYLSAVANGLLLSSTTTTINVHTRRYRKILRNPTSTTTTEWPQRPLSARLKRRQRPWVLRSYDYTTSVVKTTFQLTMMNLFNDEEKEEEKTRFETSTMELDASSSSSNYRGNNYRNNTDNNNDSLMMMMEMKYPNNNNDNNNNNNHMENDEDYKIMDSKFLSVASPLSQWAMEEDQDATMPTFSSKDENWLERATEEMLNTQSNNNDSNRKEEDEKGIYPLLLGRLTVEDVENITGLMRAWAKRHSVQAAIMVEQLLKRVVDDMRAGNEVIQVTTRMYTIAIDAWAKSQAPGRVQRAQHIHDTMVQMYHQTQNPLIKPSTISYNTLLNAYSKSSDIKTAPQSAERVFQEMLDLYQQGDEYIKPDSITFSTIMDCYSKSNSPNSIERSEELFRMMDKLGVRRNVYTFSALQNVYARSGRSDGPPNAEAVLRRMLDLYHNQGDIFAKPNCINYNAVLGALSRTPCRTSVQRAHDFLQLMELPVEQGGFDVEPDRLSYALTILCCTRCPDDEVFGSTMAEINLLKMETRAKQDATKKQELSSAAPPLVSLDIECFNVVLTAISKCPQMDNAAARTIAIIRRMEEYAKQQHMEHLRPNVRTWNALLNVLARSKDDKKAARKAEQILNHMHDLHKRGVPNVKPDAFSFAAVLSAYQKSSEDGAVERADNILRQMEESHDRGDIDTPPDVFHYTIVCGAWAKASRQEPYRTLAPERCLQILTHMMERHQAGCPDVKPNVRTFNAVLDCLSRSKQEDRAEQLLYFMLQKYREGDHAAGPDVFSFNSVINAITRSRNAQGGKRAESILERFLEYHMHENPSVRPDSRAFTHIIAFYRRSNQPDAPYRAEHVLHRLISMYKSGNYKKELAPNNFAFTSVIESYTRAKHPDAGQCGERMLRLVRELQQDYGATKLVLNTDLLNSILHAWAVCGDENAGHQAELHLDEMERSFHEQETMEMRPDTRSYGLVLHAWSKSGTFDKARRALDVLRRMQLEESRNNNVVAGEHAFSLVINACAFSDCENPDIQDQAFHIAVTVFDELLENSQSPNYKLHPSSLAFGWFLQACGRLKVPDNLKHSQIERAFLKCCELGLVNDFVLHRFRSAAPEGMYRQLLAPALSRLPPILQYKSYDDTGEVDDIDDNFLETLTSKDIDYHAKKGNDFPMKEQILPVNSLFLTPSQPTRQSRFRLTTSQLPTEWTKNIIKGRYHSLNRLHSGRISATGRESKPDSDPSYN